MRHGFDYKKVQRVTLGSLANDEPLEEVTLFDNPAVDKKKLCISGPFTVETLQSFEPLAPDAVNEASLDVERLKAFQSRVFEHLKSAGVKNGARNENAVFVRIDPLSDSYLHAEGYVVAINAFDSDHPDEIEAVKRIAIESGALGAAVSTHWADGGKGAIEPAEMVIEAAEQPNEFRFLYGLDQPIKTKIETIAKKIYGAEDVSFEPFAEQQIAAYEANGFGNLPISMAKTLHSLSDDPKVPGRPEGFVVNVRDVRISAGAGFLVPLTGEMMTMPGLPKEPAAKGVKLQKDGSIRGLMQND